MKRLLAILLMIALLLAPVTASAAVKSEFLKKLKERVQELNQNSAPSPENNILRADDDDECKSGNSYIAMGGPYLRNQILSISFLDSLEDMPGDAWDVSAAGDRSVMAWAEPNGEYYDLYIAGEGGVTANENCEGLFRAYTNLTDFHFNGNFHTGNTQSMASMFSCLFDLKQLDLSSFDTSSLTSTYFMFSTSDGMEELILGDFDTSDVTVMSYMFNNCKALTELDLSSFDTGNAERMNSMFEGCEALRTIDVSSSFVVPEGCNAEDMFQGCDKLDSSFISRYVSSTPTPKPTAKPTAKPSFTIKPFIKSSQSYDYLYVGDEGSAVTRLQNRLIDLGYLAYGEADGDYGKKTARAVHLFKQVNNIYDGTGHDASGCIATEEMQQALFGLSPKRYVEPDFCLQFPDQSYMNWTHVSGNKLKLRVEVENVSRTRTITAFELRAYATDVWGEAIYGDGYYYYETTRKNVAPGSVVKSEYMVIPNRSEISEIHVGISRIIYSDGSVEEAYPVDYWRWQYTG